MAYTNFTNCTANEYKNILYNQQTDNKIKILFNNVELEDADEYCETFEVQSRVIPHGSKVFALSNLVSQEATLVLHNIDTSIIQDQVSISIGTLVSENTYEYVPIGIYNLQELPTTDNGKTTIKLRDNSVKLDFLYNAKPIIDEHGGSATKLQILQDICTQAGITCNVSSFIGSSDLIGIYDNTIKGRQYVSWLAESAGAMPIITRSGALDFVYLNNLATQEIPIDIVEKYTNAENFEISKVVYEDATRKYEYGNETKDTLFIDSANPYISSQSQIDSIYPLVNGFNINSFTTGRILGNPAIDAYDLIQIHDKSKGIYNATKAQATTNTVVWSGDTQYLYFNGTPSANGNLNFPTKLFQAGTYTLSFEIESGSTTGSFLWYIYGSSYRSSYSSLTSTVLKNSITFTLENEENIYIHIYARTGNTLTNLKVKYQITNGDSADYNFEPYYDYTFTTFANNALRYNGKLVNTFDSEISFEQKKENVSLTKQATFKKWAKTEIDNANAQITIQAGQIEEIENDLSNPTNQLSGTSFDIEDALDQPLQDFKMYGDTQQDSTILPSEYQQVEYIQSDGNQYIDTGFQPKQNTGVEIKCEVLQTSTTYIFGVNSSTNRYMLAQQSSNNRLIADLYSSSYRINSQITGYENGVHTLKIQNKTFYVDGVSKGTASCPDFETGYNAYLFAENTGSSVAKAPIKVYYCKIWDNTTLVRDMIPCYRKSDNVIGMYDLVNNVFYTNQGTGTFTKGNNVTLPTPDYPQEIHNVSGDNTIYVCGSNIFDGEFEQYGWEQTVGYQLTKVSSQPAQGRCKNKMEVQPNTNYVFMINGQPISENARYIFADENNIILSSIATTGGKITTPTNCKYLVFHSTSLRTNYGTTLPNPLIATYQSQLISLGVENLFDKDTITSGSYISDTGSIGSNETTFYSDYIEVKPNTKYSVVGKDSGWNNTALYNNSKTFISRVSETNGVFTTTNETYYVRTNGKLADINSIEITKGSTPQYVSTTPIELCKIGNYKDYIYKTDKWYLHKEIEKIIINGTETQWSMYGTSGERKWYLNKAYFDNKGLQTPFTNAIDLSNRFKVTRYISGNWGLNRFGWHTSANSMTFDTNFGESIEEWKTWLSTHNTDVYYVLETPQEIEITDTTLLEQLNNLMTLPLYKNMTHIIITPNDLTPTLNIEYLRNTSINENFVRQPQLESYYTKVETDAQINISSNAIQQSVSQMQTTIDSNGSQIESLQNQVDVLTTSTSYDISIINQKIENGVEKVKTRTGYTFDDEGMKIQKEGKPFSSTTTDEYFAIKNSGQEKAFFGYDSQQQKFTSRIEELEARRITSGVHRTETIYEDGEYWTADYYVGGGI